MPPKHLTLAILLLAFTTHSGGNTITYANKTYKTAKIGTQTWMAENLNYEAEDSVCYGNNPANCAKYGRLYNWETAKKVCPKGWHLPTTEEWDKLLRFVDGDTSSKSPYESPTAGKHLKAANGWNKDGNGTDKYSFSALPGGYGSIPPGGGLSVGSFRNVGVSGYGWSANKKNYLPYYQYMYYYSDTAYWGNSYESTLYSVRCLQD